MVDNTLVMLRHRSQPRPATLIATAVLLSTGMVMTVDAAPRLQRAHQSRAMVADLLAHVAKVVRAMHGPHVVAKARQTPGLAAALASCELPDRDSSLRLPANPFHPQLLNLPPPSRATLA